MRRERVPVRNLIISGGVAHPYEQTSPLLADILASENLVSRISEDLGELEKPDGAAYGLLTLNCVKWTCSQTPDWYDKWHFELSEQAREGILSALSRGAGLLALHAAVISFDDWPEFARIIGASWNWGVSGHPAIQTHLVRVRTGAHPVVRGISDFRIEDELYCRLDVAPDVTPLAYVHWEGRDEPVVWVRNHGSARVCYIALGHGVEAFENPAYQRLLKQAAAWCVGDSM